MGAARSKEPRLVSMENPNSVIDVSDEVVQRLKKGISQQSKENVAPTVKAPPAIPTPKKEAAAKPAKVVAPPKAAPAPRVIYPQTTQIYIPPSGLTVTAADVQRQKELELQENDALWRQRMTNLEQTLNKTNAMMEQEYSAAVEDVRKRFATASPMHQLPPCQDLKAQVIACYRANPGETLKCSEEVAAFRNCVNMHRIKKLDVEEEQANVTKPVKAG